ncbi:MAG: hypothetical protein O2809_05325 [Proteobacteria bacterium]|nr:hypothetical protein [Pseudomonadota bacterium]
MIEIKHPEYFHSLSQDVDSFMSPIKKYGINFFSHARIYKDGTRTDLTNSADINEKYYNPATKLFEVYTPEAQVDSITSDFIFLGNPKDDPTLEMMRQVNNSTHVLSMIDKNNDYTEVFNFGMPEETESPISKYMNEFNTLKLFISYFLLTFESKIILPEKDRIQIKVNNKINDELKIEGLLKKIDHYVLDNEIYLSNLKKVYIGNGVWLSNVEFKTVYLLYHGFNPSKIASILGVSLRCVNKHLSSACWKTSSCDNYHLLHVLKNLFIFSDSIIILPCKD